MTGLKPLLTIVVVEDNPVDARIICEALSRSNERYELLVIANGSEALDFFACRGKFLGRDPTRIKSVILDLCLPEVHGVEVLRAIRSTPGQESLPVMVLSGSESEVDFSEVQQLGISAYIKKPISLHSVLSMVGTTKSHSETPN